MPKTTTAVIPMSLRLDRTSPTTLSRQIFEQLRAAIVDGTLHPGARLPSTRDLAAALGVSRKSVVVAFGFLAARGLIVGRGGSGTRVAPRSGVAVQERSGMDIGATDAGPFRPGVPALDLFPTQAWGRLVARRWRQATSSQLSDVEQGSERSLCEAIATHIGISRGIRCNPDQVILFAGARQAIDLAARVLLEPGDAVCIEDPAFTAARAAFAATGASLVHVPVDREGLDVERAEAGCLAPRLIYVTPAHQYPTGVALSPSRRKALLAWAARKNAFIIEDDFGGEFQYGKEPVAPIYGAEGGEKTVIYIGTFSQSLAPAVRVGFALVPPDLTEAFLASRRTSGFGIGAIEGATLADFMISGQFGRHVRLLREAYRERRDELVRQLAAIPEIISIGGGTAGTHLVAHLVSYIDDSAVSRRASILGVETPTVRSHCAAAVHGPALVLGYGSTPPATIARGAQLLARAIGDRRNRWR